MEALWLYGYMLEKVLVAVDVKYAVVGASWPVSAAMSTTRCRVSVFSQAAVDAVHQSLPFDLVHGPIMNADRRVCRPTFPDGRCHSHHAAEWIAPQNCRCCVRDVIMRCLSSRRRLSLHHNCCHVTTPAHSETWPDWLSTPRCPVFL